MLKTITLRKQYSQTNTILTRGALGSLGVKILAAAIALALHLLLARLLGTAQYGIYVYALAWVNILVLIAAFGLETSLVRFVAAYDARQNHALLRGLLRRATQITCSAGFLIAAAAATIVYLTNTKNPAGQPHTFYLALLALPLLTLAKVNSAALRGFKCVVLSPLPVTVVRPLVLLVLLTACSVGFNRRLNAPRAMALNLAAAAATLALAAVLLKHIVSRNVENIPPRYKTRHWLAVSLPLFLIAGMHLIFNRTDIIMLGLLRNPELVGVYAVASRVAALGIFGLTSINLIAAPMISQLYSTGKLKELQQMVTLAARGSFAFTLIFGLALVIAGKYILSLFGPEFVAGYLPMLILLIGQLVNAITGTVSFLMTMTGHQNQAAAIVTFSAAVNIALNILLIPRFGLVGAAIATAAAVVLWNCMMLVYVRRRLLIDPTIA